MATERLTTYAGAICTALLPAALILLIAAGLATHTGVKDAPSWMLPEEVA